MSEQWTIFFLFITKNFISLEQCILLHFIILKQNLNTNKYYLYLDKITKKLFSILLSRNILGTYKSIKRVLKTHLCNDFLASTK